MLEILTYPDPRLKQISKPVTEFDANFHSLLDQMAVTMYASNGIGLAAPQVGHFVRAFIVDISSQDENRTRLMEFVNPRFSNGKGKIDFEEACLSVPGASEFVRRKSDIVVDYQDRFGNPQSLEASGLLAVATQHENDHLDGILFIDRLSLLKRKLLTKKITKALSL